ncbi:MULTISPECIES: ACT domain-containing protein [unclassified Dysgonomonas]|uniref:ACT domain-containing protein n=1 Tax=unclassified Dysgonomonas TaxID=2630389 RepID=UPI002472F801|nr:MULTISPECIES: ACT domain-containing protein [unclassified Dysgonomonas]
MELEILNKKFAVCKLQGTENINLKDEYFFIGKTNEEISLVCEESSIPSDRIECEKGWKAFKIKGTLDFSLVGILAKIATLLAENNISIFAISTYNTDYILVKKENFQNAITALKKNYKIINYDEGFDNKTCK